MLSLLVPLLRTRHRLKRHVRVRLPVGNVRTDFLSKDQQISRPFLNASTKQLNILQARHTVDDLNGRFQSVGRAKGIVRFVTDRGIEWTLVLFAVFPTPTSVVTILKDIVVKHIGFD
jgi:hypothetical protein